MITYRHYGYTLGNANPGNGTIWLDEVSCRGTEADIASCSRKSWGNHDCDHSEDVSLRCTDRPTLGIIKIRYLVWLSNRHYQNMNGYSFLTGKGKGKGKYT